MLVGKCANNIEKNDSHGRVEENVEAGRKKVQWRNGREKFCCGGTEIMELIAGGSEDRGRHGGIQEEAQDFPIPRS